MTTRLAATLGALSVLVVGCGSPFPSRPAQSDPAGLSTSLLTGVSNDSCYAGGETGHAGVLTADPRFGTRFNEAPVMWPEGFTALRYPDRVEVLDATGKVVARTGRVYYISIAPIDGPQKQDLADSTGAYPAAASCGEPWDFVDCGPPPGSGDRISDGGRVCGLGPPPPPPSADADEVRRAAAAYADAEKTALTARRALDEDYPRNPTFKQAQTYYRELMKIDVAFLHAIYDLEASFPLIHDFNLLALDGYGLVVQDRRIAGAGSMASINSQKKALKNAQDDMAAAEQQARSNLNLPPAEPE